PVAVRHGKLEGGLTGGGGVAAYDGDEGAGRQQGWRKPLERRPVSGRLRQGGRSRQQRQRDRDQNGAVDSRCPFHGALPQPGDEWLPLLPNIRGELRPIVSSPYAYSFPASGFGSRSLESDRVETQRRAPPRLGGGPGVGLRRNGLGAQR